MFNAGGPVWGLDWCPIHPVDRERMYGSPTGLAYFRVLLADVSHRHYMAVGSHPSAYTPKIGTKVSRPSPSSIQIWSFGLEEGKPVTRCEALLCIESGHANELKWCPLPSHDPVSWFFSGSGSFHGGLSARNRGGSGPTPQTGTTRWDFRGRVVLCVCCPAPERPPVTKHPRPSLWWAQTPLTYCRSHTKPHCLVRVEPIIRIELQDSSCWAFDWANSEVIAIGCTNGRE